ncbi:hypothetical protein HYQ45_009932 [Verticillium longisporum]|uniref:Uncharacterized protein n=1 Tax=Verticillium longisporum TaxID=100787 RepID=A0A8I3AMR1_VERLO|nr:hypothetical protein HYQ45_009932 [Verticillium longisporum]
MDQNEPAANAQLRPLFLSGQPQQRRGSNSCETLLSHQSEYPRNATELAVSLVNLVFPYDVRNTQRSLARMYDRVKAVEAKASIDSVAQQQAERAMGTLEKETRALQAMVAKSQPDPSEHMHFKDLETELRQKHEKMIEMVSEFNTQRESLLADVNRLVDQTKQIQQDVTARSISTTEEPIVPGKDMATYPGEAAAKVVSMALVPEKSVEAESIEPVPADDISTASESGSEPKSPREKGLAVDRTSMEKARSAKDNSIFSGTGAVTCKADSKERSRSEITGSRSNRPNTGETSHAASETGYKTKNPSSPSR